MPVMNLSATAFFIDDLVPHGCAKCSSYVGACVVVLFDHRQESEAKELLAYVMRCVFERFPRPTEHHRHDYQCKMIEGSMYNCTAAITLVIGL